MKHPRHFPDEGSRAMTTKPMDTTVGTTETRTRTAAMQTMMGRRTRQTREKKQRKRTQKKMKTTKRKKKKPTKTTQQTRTKTRKKKKDNQQRKTTQTGATAAATWTWIRPDGTLKGGMVGNILFGETDSDSSYVTAMTHDSEDLFAPDLDSE
jgi:hypothetical protein